MNYSKRLAEYLGTQARMFAWNVREARRNGKNTQIYCITTQRADQSFEKVPVRLVGLHGPMRMSNADGRYRRRTLTFTHHHECVLFARECLPWTKQCRRCAR